jgi:hypothetical protein
MSNDLSVEPSLIIINSKSLKDCDMILSIASAKYCPALYTGNMTEIVGIDNIK